DVHGARVGEELLISPRCLRLAPALQIEGGRHPVLRVGGRNALVGRRELLVGARVVLVVEGGAPRLEGDAGCFALLLRRVRALAGPGGGGVLGAGLGLVGGARRGGRRGRGRCLRRRRGSSARLSRGRRRALGRRQGRPGAQQECGDADRGGQLPEAGRMLHRGLQGGRIVEDSPPSRQGG